MLLLNLAIIYPILITFASVFYSLISDNPVGIYFALGNIIFGFSGNIFFKKIFKMIDPKCKLFQRPNPPKWGCGQFLNYEMYSIHNNFGMPSGHAQIAVLAATFWILYLLDRPLNRATYLTISILIAMTVIVVYSRIYIGCHNILQVVVGSFIGLVLGILLYRIWTLWPCYCHRVDYSKFFGIGILLIFIVSLILTYL